MCTLPGLAEKLKAVCDVNDKYDEPMLRYSDSKVLSWLRRKVVAVRDHLAATARDGVASKQASSLELRPRALRKPAQTPAFFFPSFFIFLLGAPTVSSPRRTLRSVQLTIL